MRTPCTTTGTGWPSYRCTRPTKTSTLSGPARSARMVPACPDTVAAGNPPSSVAGNSVTSAPSPVASTSAAGAQPEPSTTAASYVCWPVSSASRAALAAAAG